ncbi:hypothetical protein [Bradyrhizobium erythrophlei]|uniref:Uncharacterized protein n=1 Tax=Bradyrhizobium erythrophlei TaxID=1437360 RepID=A0A1M5M7J7_9BRAD|nr:hypothetical protein [Bradyrhizobium erythrophlei]SHG72743.1 hypothetical protein SAMN05444169_3844 [Bradyrhizobium erythrophlei]
MSLERKMLRMRAQLLKHAKSLPQIPFDQVQKPGTVTHAIFAHDAACRAARTHRLTDCSCAADVSFHREPAE